jgi:tRNA modification GTPase
MTASRPGAVAVLQLHGLVPTPGADPGAGVEDVLGRVTGQRAWEPGRLRLVDIAGIDRGLAVLLRAGVDGVAQLMPHGGPRVVRSILEKLADLGVRVESAPDPMALYPEADSPIQADALFAIARAASPAAIDLLLAQPDLWRKTVRDPRSIDRNKLQRDSKVLDRLIEPPTVVVGGLPNVGKSTLTNRLMGRAVSLVADLPGTTRDWVGAVVQLGGFDDAVAVRWLDTPGLRDSTDTIEQRAIGLARDQIASADVLIVMRDPQQGWPEPGALPREPDLRVVNKVDEEGGCVVDPGAIGISALAGRGIDTLQRRIIETLGLDRVGGDNLWAFSQTLQAYAHGDTNALKDYLAV